MAFLPVRHLFFGMCRTSPVKVGQAQEEAILHRTQRLDSHMSLAKTFTWDKSMGEAVQLAAGAVLLTVELLCLQSIQVLIRHFPL